MLSKAERSVYIKAPRNLVFGILAAYNTYRRWAPDITESRSLANEGEVSVVELRSPPLGDGKLVLEFVKSPTSQLVFHQVDQLDQGGLAGAFELEEADGGGGVVVRAMLSRKRRLLEFGLRRRTDQVLARTLSALRSRALRMVAAGSTGEMQQRTKILQLSRDGEALVVDLNGQAYVLEQRVGEQGR